MNYGTLLDLFSFLLVWLQTALFCVFNCSRMIVLTLVGVNYPAISAQKRSVLRLWCVRVVIYVTKVATYLTKYIFLVAKFMHYMERPLRLLMHG